MLHTRIDADDHISAWHPLHGVAIEKLEFEGQRGDTLLHRDLELAGKLWDQFQLFVSDVFHETTLGLELYYHLLLINNVVQFVLESLDLSLGRL